MQPIKVILTVLAIALYISLGHMSMISTDPYGLWRQAGVLIVVAPIVAILGWSLAALLATTALPRRARQVLTGSAVLIMCGLCALAWSRMLDRLELLYLAQHTASNLLLCYFFGRTLVAGRTPIVSVLARTIHGPLPEKIVRYTRKVTLAWSLFFAAQVVVSLLIYVFLPLETWSWFANVLNWPLVVLMFVGEFFCRKIANPDFKHATLRQSIAAYCNQRNKA